MTVKVQTVDMMLYVTMIVSVDTATRVDMKALE